jgi:hypothetical protein
MTVGTNLEILPIAKPYRQMSPQEKADYRAAENARTQAAVKETIKKIHLGTLDIIFAGKKTVSRATAERRLRARGEAMNRQVRRSAKKQERRPAKRSDVTHVGINSHEFLKAATKTCADVVSGRISPTEANAIVARQRTALKMLELQIKFGGGEQS